MPDGGRCRLLTPADLEVALRLYRDLVGDIPLPAGDTARARWLDVLSHDGTTVWGYDSDVGVVAMATLHILPNMTFDARPYALVENVVTATGSQKLGYGRAVMEHVIETAWQANAYKIMLLTGTELGARGFYEGLGFAGDQKHGMILRRAPQRRPLPAI